MTGGVMFGSDAAQSGNFFAALFLGNRAAWMKRTTGRRMNGRGNVTRQKNALPF
jgi:hypothetical protein